MYVQVIELRDNPAFCQWGWNGPSHPGGDAGAVDGESADLAAHLAASGHQPFADGVPALDGYHQACGHFHDLNCCCPAPPDSPTGRLRRVTSGGTLGHPERALDRLAALAEMRVWLDDQEAAAVIGARMAGCTWAQMGQTIGGDGETVRDRWGQMIAPFALVGLLPHGE